MGIPVPETMKTPGLCDCFWRRGLIGVLLAAGIVLGMVMPKALQAQAVMTSFSGATAPGNWELVPWSPTGTYWFDGTDTATTLAIVGAFNTTEASLTTVQMESGASVGRSGYLVFEYQVEQNQATAAGLSVYRLYDGGRQLLATLTGSGRYMSEPVFGPSDRVAFELSSTLAGGKLAPAEAIITPIPEPEEWAVVIAAGLGFYGVYRHGKRKARREDLKV